MILTIDLEKESAAGLRRALQLIEQALAEKEPSRPERPAPLMADRLDLPRPERAVPSPERAIKKEPVFDLPKKEDKDKDKFSGVQVY